MMFHDLFATSNINFLCGIIFYVISLILKLQLPKIFINFANKYEDSFINKFVEFIHKNPQKNKFILLFAFCFDLPFIYFATTISNIFIALVYLPYLYIVIYGGGVLFFYIILYRELQIKCGKIKTFF